MATVLSSLKVIYAVKQVATDSAQFRREKLCKKLDEQISLAMAVSEGNTYTVKRQRNIKDKDSGLTTTVEVNKRVRQWWFVNRDTNKVALQLRYGTKVIEFAKGKNAIEVSSGEELIPCPLAWSSASVDEFRKLIRLIQRDKPIPPNISIDAAIFAKIM